jgi:tRNA-splicing ligase RtcB
VWLFPHSGSRGVGNKVAQHHIKVAQKLCERWWIQLPDRDLACLVEGTDEFWDYIRQLRWAQKFALLDREEMMNRVATAFCEWTGVPHEPVEQINCHHNHTTRERHFGKDVWLSRKGAIDASQGTPGLIPGSMGTVVRRGGKGERARAELEPARGWPQRGHAPLPLSSVAGNRAASSQQGHPLRAVIDCS